MKGRVVAALVGVFVVGLAIGALVALAVSGDDTDDDAPTAEQCADAQEVVASSTAQIEAIDSVTETQDINYFASILVELESALFAMDDVPDCFSIGDRARAAGFLQGVELSLRFLEIQPATPSVPVLDTTPEAPPADGDAPADEEPPASGDE